MKNRYLLSKIIERKSNIDKFIEVLHIQTWLTSPEAPSFYHAPPAVLVGFAGWRGGGCTDFDCMIHIFRQWWRTRVNLCIQKQSLIQCNLIPALPPTHHISQYRTSIPYEHQ